MKKLKCGCGNDKFKIEKRDDCADCVHNGANSGYSENKTSKHFDQGYVYDPEIIKELGIERSEAEDDGECEMGSAEGEGCYIYICSLCEKIKEHLYLVDP